MEAVAEPLRESVSREAVIERELQAGAAEAAVEAAELEYVEYVGAIRRFIAIFIDIIIYGVLSWIVGYFLPDTTAAALASTLIIFLVYFGGFWSWRGQTPGKMILRSKIMMTDGTSINPIRALMRALIFIAYYIPFFFLGYWVLGPGWAYIFVVILIIILLLIASRRKDKRAIHDLILGTMVISSQSDMERLDEGEEID